MRTLLLADDSITVQRVIALTFAEGPVRVVSVSDGQQAIERIVAQRPDIVLAGTTLPQVNGYDLAKFVRSKPELKDVPVLLLSSAFETVDEVRLKSSGAAGVMEKPVEPNAVIKLVKELLGLASDAAPAPAAGRLITSVEPPADRKTMPTPTPPRALTSTIGPPSRWEQLRDRTLEPNARSVEDAAPRDNYMDSLDAAFDTLDQHLAGKGPARPPRNPAGPLGLAQGAGDPRSPGRRPADTAPPNPVFEVDDEWFSGESKAREDARAGRREMWEELSAPELQPPAPPAQPATPIFEVDDEWFKESDQARAARLNEQRVLAAEMGIHEVELPEAGPAPNAPTPALTVVPDSARAESGERRRDHAEAVSARERGPQRPADSGVPPPERPPIVEKDQPAIDSAPPVKAVPPPSPATSPPAAPAPPKVAARPFVPTRPPVAAPPPFAPPSGPASRPAPAPTPASAVPSVAVTPPPPTPTESAPEPAVQPTPGGSDFRPPSESSPYEPVARSLPIDWFHAERRRVAGTPVAPAAGDAQHLPPRLPGARDTANDFETLLAFEQGEQVAPPMIEPIIHLVAPEITPPMLDQIAATVAERLTGSIRVEPAPPVITSDMIKMIALLVAGQLKDEIRVDAAAPDMTPAVIEQIAGIVADKLTDRIRVDVPAPQIDAAALDQVAATVAARLTDNIRVEPAIPELTAPMLDQMSKTVAAGLAENLRVDVPAPQITGELLDRMSSTVAAHLVESLHVDVPAPQITSELLDQVTSRLSDRLLADVDVAQLRGSIVDTVRNAVISVVSETSERLVKDEINRIKSKSQG